jgi:hypothetical protein
MASAAPVAAILRRGPSRWYHVIAWDTERDTFIDGAWMKGHIHDHKCDLSPDGKLLLYFCHGGRTRPGYTDSWTAVSRLPWLHALALWPWGTTYGGGGRFVGERELVLRPIFRDGGPPRPIHPDHPGIGLKVRPWRPGDTPDQRGLGEPGTQWSGLDQRGRLVFCRGGKLFRRGLGDTELADFNGREPAPAPAPDWAREPLPEAAPGRRSRRHR